MRMVLAPISLIIFSSSVVAYVLMAVIAQVHTDVGKDVAVGKGLAADDAALRDAVQKSRGAGP